MKLNYFVLYIKIFYTHRCFFTHIVNIISFLSNDLKNVYILSKIIGNITFLSKKYFQYINILISQKRHQSIGIGHEKYRNISFLWMCQTVFRSVLINRSILDVLAFSPITKKYHVNNGSEFKMNDKVKSFFFHFCDRDFFS